MDEIIIIKKTKYMNNVHNIGGYNLLKYSKIVIIEICTILVVALVSLSFSASIECDLIYVVPYDSRISIFEQNLSQLQPGDIAFMHPDISPTFLPTIIDHCLLFIEYNSSSDMYVFIEAGAVNSQVQYRYENESSLTGLFFGPFAKVKHANTTQKQNAIDFAKRQLGKSFQGEWINKNFNPEDTDNDPYADEWYCSELIWAAYYNCNNTFPIEKPETGYIYGAGIDLDRNGWHKNVINSSIVTPKEILWNRYEISAFCLKPLDFYLLDLFDDMQSLFNHFFKGRNI